MPGLSEEFGSLLSQRGGIVRRLIQMIGLLQESAAKFQAELDEVVDGERSILAAREKVISGEASHAETLFTTEALIWIAPKLASRHRRALKIKGALYVKVVDQLKKQEGSECLIGEIFKILFPRLASISAAADLREMSAQFNADIKGIREIFAKVGEEVEFLEADLESSLLKEQLAAIDMELVRLYEQDEAIIRFCVKEEFVTAAQVRAARGVAGVSEASGSRVAAFSGSAAGSSASLFSGAAVSAGSGGGGGGGGGSSADRLTARAA
ncbi:MAG: hypothetical protein A3E87_06920 [Gammaproteobacteria bacterium RIFCSPHIGHO2_12_FULL_35_23]|nr:MAG: hypothetical protein A3E87_06920 [Gammaproteobacteria bacterium RIFCSPHIGHO2_12_FULL_35_23]